MKNMFAPGVIALVAGASSVLILLLCATLPGMASAETSTSKVVVLIGGASNASFEGPFQHDFPAGITLLKKYLVSSPDIRALGGVSVEAYPDGWPSDPGVLERASTIVLYCSGLEKHPLYDAARRAQLDRLMRKGVGLVALHQATTLMPHDEETRLQRWLGAARYGMVDRANEPMAYTPPEHPVTNGVRPFAYKDEFYATLRFERGRVTPILTGRFHVEDGYDSKKRSIVTGNVAWAYEREGGGRSFGFTGLHYLAGLDQPDVRKLVLNAIVWSAGIDVPNEGIRSGPPTGEEGAIVSRAADAQVLDQSWGKLTWFTSAEIGNSATLKLGQAVIRQNQQNPLHHHPNCDEVLRVEKGRILQTIGNKAFEMGPGDVASIPQGLKHNARNIGTEDAILSVSYSSAFCRTIGE